MFGIFLFAFYVVFCFNSAELTCIFILKATSNRFINNYFSYSAFIYWSVYHDTFSEEQELRSYFVKQSRMLKMANQIKRNLLRDSPRDMCA